MIKQPQIVFFVEFKQKLDFGPFRPEYGQLWAQYSNSKYLVGISISKNLKIQLQQSLILKIIFATFPLVKGHNSCNSEQ